MKKKETNKKQYWWEIVAFLLDFYWTTLVVFRWCFDESEVFQEKFAKRLILFALMRQRKAVIRGEIQMHFPEGMQKEKEEVRAKVARRGDSTNRRLHFAFQAYFSWEIELRHLIFFYFLCPPKRFSFREDRGRLISRWNFFYL